MGFFDIFKKKKPENKKNMIIFQMMILSNDKIK